MKRILACRLKLLMLVAITGNVFFPVNAGEGMWLPLLLDSLNYKDMQEKGLRLSPGEIYNINHSSLKDAVVIFGGGCTGELISPEGLLITNHHCGYSRIQAHSTVEKDYLTNGFWAGSLREELPNPGLNVTFLVRMEDVTEKVLDGVTETMAEADRTQLISNKVNSIRQEAVEGTHYQAEVKPFYFGKAYYLFVYEVYKDVRLVGTPPESIGRFGGDTDNWIWPRHTGDFSLFRIYAGKDNKPADYSPDNVPFKPKKYLNISMNGVREGDFTMILGYPGRTDQYLTSDALEMIALKALPAKIDIRTERLNALQDEMARGPENRLRYASKYVGISNAWKKWIGVTNGVERSGAVDNKKKTEDAFEKWAAELPADPEGYATLMDEFSRLYNIYKPLYLAYDIGSEMLSALELSSLINRSQTMFFGMADSSAQSRKIITDKIITMGDNYFNNGALEIDRRILPSLLRIYYENTDQAFQPDFYATIRKEYSGDYQQYVNDLFEKSFYTNQARYNKLFSKSGKAVSKKLSDDPLTNVYREFLMALRADAYGKLDSLNREINKLYRKYVTGLQAMDTAKLFYPDANFTMRLTYGKVEGYVPADAVYYDWYSTLDGIIEKEDTAVADYHVPVKLKEVYVQDDTAPYAIDGKVPVCFIASNHTSGGNSGSPVLDANGNLVGINFDRNWEGTVSDYAYDPEICRNISLDIRYVLFIIDKVADADWLLDELTLIKN